MAEHNAKHARSDLISEPVWSLRERRPVRPGLNDNHSAICYRGQQGPRRRTDRMIFKIIAFLAAAIPIFLFVRSIFFRRTTRVKEGLREFKKQANLAVSIFLFLIVCVVVFAAGKLAWTWWSSL